MLHWRCEYQKLTYPETPALARLVQYPNYFDFTEDCYREVVLLGRVSGVTYSQYVRQFGIHEARPSSAAANPINLTDEGDDAIEDNEHEAQIIPTNSGSSSEAFYTDQGSSVNWTISDEGAVDGQYSTDLSREVSSSGTTVNSRSVGAPNSVGSVIESRAFITGR